jgi:hypothetical protein
MPASARLLRTGDDAGANRLGGPSETRHLSVYVDPMPAWAVTSNVNLSAAIAPSASFDVLLPSIAVAPAFPTGQDILTVLRQVPVRNWFPFIDIVQPPTGYGWMLAPVLSNVVAQEDATEADETDEPTATHPLPVRRETAGRVTSLRESTPESVAAARVRELSGLEGERVAELLGVTRQAFYDWLDGVKPRGKRRDHLMQVQHVLEEAARRRGSPRDVATWLMTPSQVSNRIPFDLLKEHQYDLCRSLLTKTARPRIPTRARRRFAGDELRESLERITSRPAPEDYDDDPAEE